MEEYNTVNDVQGENVDAGQPIEPTPDVETTTAEDAVPDSDPGQERTEETESARLPEQIPKTVQTPEQNRWLARAPTGAGAAQPALAGLQQRLEQQRLKQEADAARKEQQRLVSVLNQYGYQGGPEEIADSIEAAQRGIPISQLRQERQTQEAQVLERVQQHPEFLRATQEAQSLRGMIYEQIRQQDLKELKKADPTLRIQSVGELGEDYLRLRASGVGNLAAFEAVKAAQQDKAPKKPPEIGGVNRASSREKDYYSPEEVDRLSPAQLDDPGIWERVRKSMTRWK